MTSSAGAHVRKRGELNDSYTGDQRRGSHACHRLLLARDHGITDVAILEKLHRLGRAGAQHHDLRSNYKPWRAEVLRRLAKLYEGLGAELTATCCSPRTATSLWPHTDLAMFVMATARGNRLNGIDSQLIYPDEIKKLAPAMQVDNPDTVHPIMGALYHRQAG